MALGCWRLVGIWRLYIDCMLNKLLTHYKKNRLRRLLSICLRAITLLSEYTLP